MARKCGECLMERVEVVELRLDGVCPSCGTDYGPDLVEFVRRGQAAQREVDQILKRANAALRPSAVGATAARPPAATTRAPRKRGRRSSG